MSQDTIQYSSQNRGTRIYVEGRGGYRSCNSHYSSHNQFECGKLLNSPGYTVGGDGIFGYMSQTIQ